MVAYDPTITNALTVDVEDYFQVSAFEGCVRREAWDSLPGRVEANTDHLLELFGEYNARATFFTLGWVAERYPGLVRRIVAAGHEIASHGHSHVRVPNQTPAQFRSDVDRTKKLLEDVSGQETKGYRAASYSISPQTLWALDILKETGHQYSSSIYPIRHDTYGMPTAPRFAFRYGGDDGLLEIPVSTLALAGQNLPCGGGGYFRLFPYAFSRWAMTRINRREGRPCVFYFHPWEIDPGQPKQHGIGLKTRVRHYLNLHKMESRIRTLLADFHWDRMDRVFGNGINKEGSAA